MLRRVADADERGELRWIAAQVRAVARRAIPLVQRLAVRRLAVGHLPLGQLHRPRHLVGVDVEETRGRVERDAAPLAAAVHPGKEHRALHAGRIELAALPQLLPRSRTAFSASGVRFVIRSSVNRCRVNGGGSVGSICVVAACSPSTSEAGTVTSFIG